MSVKRSSKDPLVRFPFNVSYQQKTVPFVFGAFLLVASIFLWQNAEEDLFCDISKNAGLWQFHIDLEVIFQHLCFVWAKLSERFHHKSKVLSMNIL